MRPLTGTFRAMGLDSHGVQVTVAEAVATESFGGQIVPGLGLGVLKARRWSLVHARVPVQGVGAETGGAGGDAICCCRDVATGDGMKTVAGRTWAIVSVRLLLLLISLALNVVMMLHVGLLLLLLLLLMEGLFITGASLFLTTSTTRYAIRIAAGTGEIVSI